MSDNRALYFTGKTLTLVGMAGDKLEVLDQLDTSFAAERNPGGGLIWIGKPGTFIFSLENDRVAIVSSSRGGIDLYDLQQDRISPAGTYLSSSRYIEAATGGGHRIWTCSTSIVNGYQVDATTAAITPWGSLTLRAICEWLALLPDGKTLAVATTSGLSLVDVSSVDGTMSMKASGLEGHFIFDVEASGGTIVAYEVHQDAAGWVGSGYGDVWVLAADTLTPIASFPMNLKDSERTPAGFALAAGGLVLEQATIRPGCGSTVAEFYALGSDGASLKSQSLLLEACQNMDVSSRAPLSMVGRGNYAVLEPTEQMVRIDPKTGAMSPLVSLRQGSFERVRAASPNTVAVHSPISTHVVDISDPEAPIVKAGGLLMPNQLERLRIGISKDLRPSFLNIDSKRSSSDLVQKRPITSVLRANESGLPTPAGSIVNDDETSEWFASGRFIYQLAPLGDSNFRLTRFAASSMTRENKQKLSPDLDQVVTALPVISGKPWRTWFDVDSQTGDLAIVQEHSPTLWTWFTLGADRYAAAAAQPAQGTVGTGTIAGFALAGGRGVLAYANSMVIVSRSGDIVATRSFDKSDVWVLRSVLGFTRKRVYVTATFVKPASTTGVLVLNADDLSEVARYATRELVLSMAEVGTHLVFGMNSTLTVAEPACP